MSNDFWQKVDDIYHAALERGPEARSTFLDNACAGDAQLRGEVESLLEFDGNPTRFIDAPAIELEARAMAEASREGDADLPKEIGPYRILSLLGIGGMGEVYLAADKLGRRVALKRLASRLNHDQQHVARFLQEAQTLLTLNHPNIVTLYDIGEADGSYYIASELVEGQTLRSYIENTNVELGARLEIAIQIATALAAAHEKGIIHRDIKPENVMIRRDGYVKVLDFGVAKLTQVFQPPLGTEAPTRPKVETAEGLVIGTATHLSPEQARGWAVDARTDIWSFGVTLYEMLTGRAPFTGATVVEIIAHILEREPMPLARYVTDTPPELQRILNKTLMKNRDERYQTITEMLLDLRAVKQELEFAAKLELSSSIDGAEVSEKSRLVRVQTLRAREGAPSTRPASSAEYIVRGIQQHKSATAMVVVVLLLASLSIGYWSFIHRSSNSITNATTIDSIAVMPFENVTHEKNTEYLSDGVTESLINSLSQLPHVKVIARNSVFSYKNQTPDLRQVAKQLNVQAVLTGRVFMEGDTLDVRVELTDASSNAQLWGDHFTRKVADIFTVQDEIAHQVTDALRVHLTSGQQEQVSKRYTENAEAYGLYLQGRYYENQGSEESNNRAISFFDQAIALDPRYALAYAARGETYFNLGDLSLPMKEAGSKTRQDVAASLGIDDKLVEGHMLRANLEFQYDWDFARADTDFRQAIALNPNYAEAHHQYMYYLAMMGRPLEGVAEMNLATQLDPVSPSIVVDTALPYFLARQYDQAIAQARKGTDMFPNFFLSHMVLGELLVEKGDTSSGLEELEKAKSMEPTPLVISKLGYAYAKIGRKDEARKLLAKLKDESKSRYVAPFFIAIIYIGLTEKDEAFAWLEKSYQDREFWLCWLKMDPKLDSLRSDSRFIDLMRRVGFP